MRGVLVSVCGFVVAVAVSASACGGSPSGPSGSGDTGGGGGGGATHVAATYLASVTTSGGRTGSLMARASTSLQLLARRPERPTIFQRLLASLETPLHAQEAATGRLIFDDGGVVALTGTFSANSFALSGDGYAFTTVVSGNSLSGSGTGPGGISLSVSTLAVPVGALPSKPEGTYHGTFSIQAQARWTSQSIANGTYFVNCTYNLIISGTVEILIRSDPGSYYGHLTTDWKEVEGPKGTCPNPVLSSPVVPRGPYGTDYSGPATTLQFWMTDRGTSNGALIERTETFIGAFSGSNIVGKVSFGLSATGTDGSSQNFQGYPMTGVDVTLVK